jgi:DNA-binding PadR family transcriptional regulator
MTKPYPNIRQRDVLQKLMQAEWTPHQRLAPAGDRALENMVSNGWIERRAGDSCSYRITDLGRQAFKLPVPLR